MTALQNTVLANRALHWDLQAVMGGPGSMSDGWTNDGPETTMSTSLFGARKKPPKSSSKRLHERALWANRRIQPAKLMAP